MPLAPKPYSFWAEMFLWLLAVLAMLGAIWALDAHAQNKIEFRILSPGIEGKVNKTYERVQCYVLKDYLELAQFDSELFSCRLDTKTYLDLQGALGEDVPMVPLFSTVTHDSFRGIAYPFAAVLDGLTGAYGAPELAFTAEP